MATMISGGPSARRVASSSSTMPDQATTTSCVDRRAGPLGQAPVEQEEIGGAEGADQGQHPVLDRDVVAGELLNAGKRGKARKTAKARWMERASVSLKTPKLNEERQRRGDTRAGTGPGQRGRRAAPCRAARVARPGIDLGDQVLCVFPDRARCLFSAAAAPTASTIRCVILS